MIFACTIRGTVHLAAVPHCRIEQVLPVGARRYLPPP
jgi:hypothetical protein